MALASTNLRITWYTEEYLSGKKTCTGTYIEEPSLRNPMEKKPLMLGVTYISGGSF